MSIDLFSTRKQVYIPQDGKVYYDKIRNYVLVIAGRKGNSVRKGIKEGNHMRLYYYCIGIWI